MNIVWATSEAVPYAKTGGLADVSAALPKALARRGHSIHVIMPYYPQQMAKLNLKFDAVHEMLGVPFGDANEWAQIRILKVERNLTCCFIEFNRFYDRATLYDWNGSEYPDNAQRFIFFSRAVMQTVLALGLHPDILHLNDWHCALCSVYLRSSLYSGFRNFADCRSVMTIHNIGYQGVYDQGNLYWTGLGWEYFNFRCLEFYNRMNLLKGGIMCADMVSTVSPTYAEEILSPEYGFSLDSSLRHCAYHGRLRGILNGIDVSEWNPASDPSLPAVFSPDDMGGKAVCKAALQEHFKLPVREDVPLFGVISRLAYQKGLDVFADSLEDMLYHDDSQFILIGSGDPWLQARFSSLSRLCRRARGASGGGGRGSVCHAFPLRALRTQPDVQHAIRHAAGRPEHRRTRRHGPELQRRRSVRIDRFRALGPESDLPAEHDPLGGGCLPEEPRGGRAAAP